MILVMFEADLRTHMVRIWTGVVYKLRIVDVALGAAAREERISGLSKFDHMRRFVESV